MAEGSVFIWIAWIGWVILVFFCRPTPSQSFFSVWILIILSSMHITVYWTFLNTSLAFVSLFIGSMVAHVYFRQTLYHLFCALAVTLAYMSINIWALTMPILVFLPRVLLFPILILSLLIVMTKHVQSRLIIGLLGLTNGELIYKLVITSYNIPVKIGTFAFFDQVVMVVTFIFGLYLLQWIQQHVHFPGISFR